MTSKVALVTGAGGLIGNYIAGTAAALAPSWKIHALTRSDVDLTDHEALRRLFHTLRPQLVVHCAAISKPLACQQQPDLAHKVNVEATAFLAELAADIPFIFFSSDLVFDGCAGNYDECAPVNPLSFYAETKVAAERIVLANPQHVVLRVGLNGGLSPTGDRGFNEEMRRAWQAGQMLTLFTDEFRCPIPAAVTARAVWELVGKYRPGLYHLCGSERLSRWQIGQLLASRWSQMNPKLQPASRRDYHGPPRPQDVSLNCAKLQALLSFPLPGLTEWLAAHPDEPF
ncbi:MAG: SDR family oxidoreductase [Nitrospirae bacterium]|nr:MAG: SDR family oxidoreductase [Nitrospirota bacterium]